MRWLLAVTCVVGLLSCVQSSSDVSPTPDALHRDEYAIYRAALELVAPPVLVLRQVDGKPDLPAELTEWAVVDSTLARAFLEAIQTPATIDSAALGARGARVVDEARLPRWPMDLEEQIALWADLEARYGQGATFVRFSRVGFDKGRTQALVSYVVRSGPTCHFAEFQVLFARSRHGWSPMRSQSAYC